MSLFNPSSTVINESSAIEYTSSQILSSSFSISTHGTSCLLTSYLPID
jgi:hypothetical protein